MTSGNFKTTEAVVWHHLQALVSRDLDGIMEDYAPEAVVFTPQGVSKGLEKIRANFTTVLQMLTPEAMANMKVIKQELDGEYLYALWSAPPAVPFGGDTFHVSNGKIIMQTFVGQMGP